MSQQKDGCCTTGAGAGDTCRRLSEETGDALKSVLEKL